MALKKWRFKKDDFIKHGGKLWKCVVADKEVAAFGQLTFGPEGEQSVSYTETFFVGQEDGDGFVYSILNKKFNSKKNEKDDSENNSG